MVAAGKAQITSRFLKAWRKIPKYAKMWKMLLLRMIKTKRIIGGTPEEDVFNKN